MLLNSRLISLKPHDKTQVQQYAVTFSANQDRFNFIGEQVQQEPLAYPTMDLGFCVPTCDSW